MIKSHFIQKLLFSLFFFSLFFLFLHPVGGDGDFYHHINAGKDIIINHRLQYTDTFTFTASGKEWINHSWLSGVFFYLLDNAFGFHSISIVVALIAVVTLILFIRWLKSYNLSNVIIFFLTLFVAAVLSTRWPSRPEIFTYPFFISLLFLDRLRTRNPFLIFFYPLIILFWANLYGGGVIVGDMLIIIFMCKQFLVDRWKFNKSQKMFYIVSFVSLILSLANGYGLKSLFYLYFIKDISKTQLEWYGAIKLLSDAPYAYLLKAQYSILIYFIYLVLLVILVTIRFRRAWKFPFEAFLSLSIFVPLFAFRQFPLASIISAPLLGLLLSHSTKPVINRVAIIAIASVAIASTIISIYINPPSFQQPTQYPSNLVSFMKNNNLKGNVLNDPQDGGFLSYYLYPTIHIYADTRDELYLGTNILGNYYNALAEGKIPQLLTKYKIDIVVGELSQGDAYEALFNSPNWVPVYIGGQYFVAIPRATAQKNHIAILNSIDPFSPTQAKKGDEVAAVNIYRNIALGKYALVDDQLRLAYALFSLKKYDETINALVKIQASQTPDNVLFNMSRDYLTGLAYLDKGDCDNAIKYFDKTNQGIKGIMLFTSSKTMPPLQERGYEYYNQHCVPTIQSLPAGTQ